MKCAKVMPVEISDCRDVLVAEDEVIGLQSGTAWLPQRRVIVTRA